MPGGLAVRDHRRPRRGLEGGPGRHRRRRRLVAGGPDHLFPMQLAAEVGIDPNDVNYVTYDGGGPLTSALLGEKIDVGFSGLGEFEGQIEDGELRVLAVSGEERCPGRRRRPDAHRVGRRPGVPQLARRARAARASPTSAREELIGYLDRDARHDRSGRQGSRRNGWTDDFKTGDEFGTFLDEQDDRVVDDPRGAGAGMTTTTTSRPEPRGAAVVDRAQYGLAAVLGAGRRLHDRRRPRARTSASATRSGPACSPTSSAAAMVVLAVLLAVATARGDVPRPRRARTSTSPRRPTGDRRHARRRPPAQHLS